MNKYLLAKDTVNGAQGTVHITKDGKVYEIANVRNLTTQAEIQSTDMRVVGTTKIQDKPNGVKMTGTGNVYYCDEFWNDILLDYIKFGKIDYFDIQIENNDPAPTIGRRNMVYYNCHLTGTIPMSILNSEEAMLHFDFNFAIGDVERLAGFTEAEAYGYQG